MNTINGGTQKREPILSFYAISDFVVTVNSDLYTIYTHYIVFCRAACLKYVVMSDCSGMSLAHSNAGSGNIFLIELFRQKRKRERERDGEKLTEWEISAD